MSKSIIYAGNSNTQITTESGTIINFTNVVRKYGCNLNLNGGNVVASGSGYYQGSVNLEIDGTVAGNVVVNVMSNGTVIPYATASLEVTASSVNSVVIPFVVRNTCNCIDNNISVVVSGAIVNVTNAAIVVEKE